MTKKNTPPSPPQPPGDRRPGKPSLKVRLLALVVSPLLFLTLAEVVLRLLGWGIPGTFWIPWSGRGESVYVVNRRYCEHFVPKALSRQPSFSSFSKTKASDTRRIVVLGGSAAYGDPEPEFGFCRQLEFLLNEHAEGVTFEVINAAVTSMNSHVARRIARDAVRHKPDLFVVFMGNNEVVGPYGPPTLPASLYASRALIDLSIAAKKNTRLGQLIMRTAGGLQSGAGSEDQWMGMESFLDHEMSSDDSKMTSCYAHFKSNLQDILETAQGCGARVLFCKPPVNLQDCAPFGSRHRPDLSAQENTEWETAWQAGRQSEQSGDWQAAWDHYQKAADLDDRFAALRFCRGRCALQSGRIEQALAEFQAARDLDTLRFRADRQLQQVVTEVATSAGMRTLDLQQSLQELCEDGVLGKEFLVDHVHLNPEGNFHAAWLAYHQIQTLLPATLAASEHPRDYWKSQTLRRQFYGPVEQYDLAMTMYQRKTRPPFVGQLDHDGEMAALREDLVRLRQKSKGFELPETVLAEMADQYENDIQVNKRYGHWLQENRRAHEAIDRFQQMLERRFFDSEVQMELALAYAFAGRRDRALEVLTDAQGAHRYSQDEALRLIGTFYVKRGRIAEAQQIYEALDKMVPDHVDTLINLASAASHRNDLPTMKRFVDQARTLEPTSVQAMITLGNYYAKMNQPETACTWFAQAVQDDPYSYLTHIGLGVQSLRCGKNQLGLQQIKQAILLKPDFVEGYNLLAAIYQEAGKPELARQYAAWRDLFKP